MLNHYYVTDLQGNFNYIIYLNSDTWPCLFNIWYFSGFVLCLLINMVTLVHIHWESKHLRSNLWKIKLKVQWKCMKGLKLSNKKGKKGKIPAKQRLLINFTNFIWIFTRHLTNFTWKLTRSLFISIFSRFKIIFLKSIFKHLKLEQAPE